MQTKGRERLAGEAARYCARTRRLERRRAGGGWRGQRAEPRGQLRLARERDGERVGSAGGRGRRGRAGPGRRQRLYRLSSGASTRARDSSSSRDRSGPLLLRARDRQGGGRRAKGGGKGREGRQAGAEAEEEEEEEEEAGDKAAGAHCGQTAAASVFRSRGPGRRRVRVVSLATSLSCHPLPLACPPLSPSRPCNRLLNIPLS